MNSSLVTADVTTHLKIVVVALLAVICVMWVGIGARMTSEESPSNPRLERPSAKPGLPATVPRSLGLSAVV